MRVTMPVKSAQNIDTAGLTAAATVPLSWLISVLSSDIFLIYVLPAFAGALFSAYLRAEKGQLKRKELLFAIASAVIFGWLGGRWLSGLMPGDDSGPVAAFCMGLLGQRAVESLSDAQFNIGAWIIKLLTRSNGRNDDN